MKMISNFFKFVYILRPHKKRVNSLVIICFALREKLANDHTSNDRNDYFNQVVICKSFLYISEKLL